MELLDVLDRTAYPIVGVACAVYRQYLNHNVYQGRAPDTQSSSSDEMATEKSSSSSSAGGTLIIGTTLAGTTVFEFPSTTITVAPQSSGDVVEWTTTLLPVTITAQLSPLITTFMPPTSCINRYYVTESLGDASVLLSGTLDPLFDGCQATSGQLIYSPGMCPGLMNTGVRAFDGTQFTELCCQRWVR